MKLTPITPSGGTAYRTPRLRPSEADFSAGWVPYAAWSHSLAIFREGPRVYIQGLMICKAQNAEILKLPVGFRSTTPFTTTLMNLDGRSAFGRVDVGGSLLVAGSTNLVPNQSYYLEGSWRTEDQPPVVLPFMQG